MELFLKDTLKTTSLMEDSTQGEGKTQLGPFFPKNQGTFFDFQKTAGEAHPPLLPLSCAPDIHRKLKIIVVVSIP